MFENFKKFTIKGGYFENAVPLKLFEKRFNEHCVGCGYYKECKGGCRLFDEINFC